MCKINNNHLKIATLLAYSLFTLVNVGCSFNPKSKDIVPDNVKIINRHPYTVSMEVRGDEGNALDMGTLIATNDLETAIKAAIKEHGVFLDVKDPGSDTDYQLTVEIDITDQPPGFSKTFKAGGIWKLQETSSKRIVMDEFVNVRHTVSFSEAFNGNTRITMAIAGAAKKFIAEGIRLLGNLDL